LRKSYINSFLDVFVIFMYVTLHWKLHVLFIINFEKLRQLWHLEEKNTALLLLVLQYLNFRSKSSIRYYKHKCNCLLKIQTFSSNTDIIWERVILIPITRNIMNYVLKDHVTLSVTFFLILEINVFVIFMYVTLHWKLHVLFICPVHSTMIYLSKDFRRYNFFLLDVTIVVIFQNL
jgi:hypothetical protein